MYVCQWYIIAARGPEKFFWHILFPSLRLCLWISFKNEFKDGIFWNPTLVKKYTTLYWVLTFHHAHKSFNVKNLCLSHLCIPFPVCVELAHYIQTITKRLFDNNFIFFHKTKYFYYNLCFISDDCKTIIWCNFVSKLYA